MDSFEINKIIAAIILVVAIVIGLDKISDGIFQVNKPEKPATSVPKTGGSAPAPAN